MERFYIPEGSKVAFTGYANRHGLEIGDEGHVLKSDGDAVHVMMRTGSRTGQALLMSSADFSILNTAKTSSIDDSLSDGRIEESPISLKVQAIYDRSGEDGVIKALASSNLIPDFELEAERVMIDLAQVIRSNPVVRTVTSKLDEESAQGIVTRIAFGAIQDLLGE